ncbi:rod shape-determining protein MreC [SAR86 cluster bacterium]|nr:rod shape-determining protein MreC [SAR86 cluster bacterium]
MFQKEHKQTSIASNAIFTTGSMRASKLLPSLIFTIFILILDINFSLGKEIKSAFLESFSPISNLSQSTTELSKEISLFFTSQYKLVNDLEEKNNEIEKLNFELLKLEQLSKENEELLEIMGYTKKQTISKSVIGEIIDMSYFPKESISIKTNIAEISEEMVALSLNGLVGIIDQIFPSYVKVIPIYEKKVNIPGVIQRTNQNIILEGIGEQNKLLIKNFKKNSNILLEDKVFTSGLGGKYPKGFLIGIVKKISTAEDDSILEVEVQSLSNFDTGTKILFANP